MSVISKNKAEKMHHIIIQYAAKNSFIPKKSSLRKWAMTVLQKHQFPATELTLRIVEPEEIIALNVTYRHKNYATNVLSFPYEDHGIQEEQSCLGDIVICAAIVNQEAATQRKNPEDHWAHMVIHGMLHLLGYDHENDNDTNIMEAEEINILATLKFPNPYDTTEDLQKL